jgi:hypothetical protein
LIGFEDCKYYSNTCPQALHGYSASRAATAYMDPSQERCSTIALSNKTKLAVASRQLAPFPGGASVPLMGMDLVGKTLQLLERANGPASAQVPGVALMTEAALKQTKAVLQTVVASALTDVPPTIAPPAWNNQPFP